MNQLELLGLQHRQVGCLEELKTLDESLLVVDQLLASQLPHAVVARHVVGGVGSGRRRGGSRVDSCLHLLKLLELKLLGLELSLLLL